MWGKAIKMMGLPMEMAERYNRMSLALAAYRAARGGRVINEKTLSKIGLKPGGQMNHARAKAFAEEIVNDAHFIYGKANRPQVLRGTAAGKLLSTAYTFRSFTHNLLSLWRWMLLHGDKEGRKAFAYSLMAMMALGGLGAVPLYKMLASLIRQLFGSDILETGVRSALPAFARDIVMYGAPSVVGIHIGGSIRMELPVLGRIQTDRSLSSQISGSMGDLIGIPWAMLEQFTDAVDALRRGDLYRAGEAVAPSVFRNVMSGYRLWAEGQTAMLLI
ncbi:hypothetical protein DSTSK_32140 [Desulforhabdus sp. TSK]|nr:hypothetical protein DSTSK_32140 [Desulforhabdus sp. TSK]